MQNYVSIHEHQTRPNPALAAVHGQAALLLRFDVPTYYVPGNSWQPLFGRSFPMTWSLKRSRFRSMPWFYDAERDCASSNRRRLSVPGTVSNYEGTGPIASDPRTGFQRHRRPGRRAVTTYMPRAEL